MSMSQLSVRNLKKIALWNFVLVSSVWANAQGPREASPSSNDQFLQLIEAEAKLAGVKDEYETTDSFNKRIRQNVGREFLITLGIEGGSSVGKKKAFSYNADAQILTVSLTGDSSLEIMRIIDSSSEEAKRIGPLARLNGRYTKFTISKTAPTLLREYTGQNAMGATAKITVLVSEVVAIALLNIPESSGTPLASIEVKMAPDLARELSKRAKWKLLIRTEMMPGQKSLVVSDGQYYKPTLESPTEIAVTGKTITASLIHGALVDPETNAVIAAFGPKNEGALTGPSPSADHAVLGIQMQPVTTAIAAALGLQNAEGAMVATVAPGSAADKAGIKVGDVLLKVAGKPIVSVMDVAASLAKVPVGSVENVTLVRKGATSEISVKF